MGYKLLEIMADGLYVVFHRFEADLCAYYRLTRMLSYKKRLTHTQHPVNLVNTRKQ